jgi:putative membrane protein
MTNTKHHDTYADKPHMLDPDVRFLLANERTLLAWIRTGLTLQAGGLALTQLNGFKLSGGFGVCIILLGGLTASIGYVRYRSADGAIRSGRLPRRGAGPVAEVIVIVGLALVLAAAYLIGLWK